MQAAPFTGKAEEAVARSRCSLEMETRMNLATFSSTKGSCTTAFLWNSQ